MPSSAPYSAKGYSRNVLDSMKRLPQGAPMGLAGRAAPGPLPILTMPERREKGADMM